MLEKVIGKMLLSLRKPLTLNCVDLDIEIPLATTELRALD